MAENGRKLLLVTFRWPLSQKLTSDHQNNCFTWFLDLKTSENLYYSIFWIFFSAIFLYCIFFSTLGTKTCMDKACENLQCFWDPITYLQKLAVVLGPYTLSRNHTAVIPWGGNKSYTGSWTSVPALSCCGLPGRMLPDQHALIKTNYYHYQLMYSTLPNTVSVVLSV